MRPKLWIAPDETTQGFRLRFWAGGEVFQVILDALKEAIPYDFREYRSSTQTWFIAPVAKRELKHLCDWARQELSARIVWGDDPDPDRSKGRQRPAQTDPLIEKYRLLHLLPTAPTELVQAARRVLARTAHPDVDGTHEAMIAINNAADAILERGAAA